MVLESNIKKSIKQPKPIKNSVQEFLDNNPHLLSRLTPTSQKAFVKICSAISHWRSIKADDFFLRTFNHLEALEKSLHRDLFLSGARRLSGLNWAMGQPYFDAVKSLPQDQEFIEQWISLAYSLGSLDIDVAVAFLEQTPKAIGTLGLNSIFLWGEQALETLKSGHRVWKAVKAYLKEAADVQCTIPLSRWSFFLEQAVRISEVSPSVAKEFIESGARVCLLLNDQETVQWITEGLTGYQPKRPGKGLGARQLREYDRPEGSRTEEDLINYFSGTSLKALEKRDGIASGVALKDRSNTLALVCEAYLGRPVKIRSNTSLTMVRGFSGGAATDGRTIYLPDTVPAFGLFKLMALHQSMLLDFDIWTEECRKNDFSTMRIHMDADMKLLKRLPGLLIEMKWLSDGGLPLSYPTVSEKMLQESMPWWGDILPGLVRETNATISQLKERTAEHADLPPDVVEGLLSNMMADGERDVEGLWDRLNEIFDTVFLSPDPEELEENVKTFFYKEWDEDLSDYKMDWCLVRQRFVKDDPNEFVEEVRTRLHGIINLIRRQFTRLKPERFQKFRAQPYGDELDIDALVQSIVDMRSSSFLDENVYIRRDKRLRDVAVLFLLDMSASTAERIHGRRIIDIQKESMVLMAEALDSLGDPYALYGFSSEGRFRVDFFNIKDFNEPYGEKVQYRLGNVQPMELTRMGTVIRHAIYKLDNISAAVKLLIILTDGRPYDYEYGSLNYAIADTKNAIQEARKHRIHPFIITSDKKGASYLRRISPQTQSIILRKVELLPTMLPAIYKRLTV